MSVSVSFCVAGTQRLDENNADEEEFILAYGSIEGDSTARAQGEAERNGEGPAEGSRPGPGRKDSESATSQEQNMTPRDLPPPATAYLATVTTLLTIQVDRSTDQATTLS